MCHRPYGLLKQLPVPEKPWNLISLDFIEKLPPSSSSYTAILVIVDRLSKQGLFILTHDMIMSQQLAQLFVLHTSSPSTEFQATSLPTADPNLSHFFHSLGIALDMKLHFTSGYHPEGDGQTERERERESIKVLEAHGTYGALISMYDWNMPNLDGSS